MSGLRMTAQRIEMLREAANDNLGFDDSYRAGRTVTTYRRWRSEHDYDVVTRLVAPLVEARLLRERHGWQHGRGYLELTAAGRIALAESGAESAAAPAAEEER